MSKMSRVKELKGEREVLRAETNKLKHLLASKCESNRALKSRLSKKINDRDATIAAL